MKKANEVKGSVDEAIFLIAFYSFLVLSLIYAYLTTNK